MQHFNLPCASCSNQLIDEGSVLRTDMGPFLLCEVCRKLYYIDVVTNFEEKPVIVIQPTHFDPQEEFNIIRYAIARVPLKDYLPQEENPDSLGSDPWGDYLKSPNEKNVNPHFEKDLKSIIEKAVTPSDLLRGLHE